MLTRKLLRDLWRQRNQALTTALVMLLGVLMFVASAGSYQDVRRSVASLEHRLALADLTVRIRAGSPADVARVRAIAGVARAEGREVADLPVAIPARSPGRVARRIVGRIISLPDSGQPRLDKIELTAGRLPHGDEVLAEAHVAQGDALRIGDRVRIDRPLLGPIDLRISGIGVSPEYIWVSESRRRPMPTPSEFGVFWMRQGDMARLAGPLVGRSPPFDEILCSLAPGADAQRIRNQAIQALGRSRVVSATFRADRPSTRILQMEFDSLASLAAFFPACFVVVAIFISAASQARLIETQRHVIGTLLALGMTRRRVLFHYLAFGLVASTSGSAIGAVAGVPTGFAMTREYADLLAIPAVETTWHWQLVLLSIAAGALASLVGSYLPAWHAASLAPAEAMRPPHAARLRGLRLARRGFDRLPLIVAYPVRNSLRRPWRSLLTALGIAAALALVIGAASVFDGIGTAMALQFDRSDRYDLRLELARPIPIRTLDRRLAAVPGVTAHEALLALPVDLEAASSAHRPIPTLLVGLPSPSPLLQSLAYGPRPAEPTPGKLVLSRSLARELHLEPGAFCRIQGPGFGPAWVELCGLSDSAIGGMAVMRLSDVWTLVGRHGIANVGLLTAPRARLSAVRQRLDAWPDARSIQDLPGFRAVVRHYVGLGYTLLGIMFVFSCVLAAAILFNTSTLAILERTREFATAQALGMPFGGITAILTLEHGLLGAVGFAVGIPAGIALGQWLLGSYQSDVFTLPFVVSIRTIGLGAGAVVAVMLLAEWPGLYWLKHLKLAEAIRERFG